MDAYSVLDNLKQRIGTLPTVLKSVIEGNGGLVADVIVETAKQSHRFTNRTGRLESSIKSKKTPTGVEAYLDTGVAKYGPYIHNGTRYIAADPFLTTAAEDSAIDKEIDVVLELAVTEAMRMI